MVQNGIGTVLSVNGSGSERDVKNQPFSVPFCVSVSRLTAKRIVRGAKRNLDCFEREWVGFRESCKNPALFRVILCRRKSFGSIAFRPWCKTKKATDLVVFWSDYLTKNRNKEPPDTLEAV